MAYEPPGDVPSINGENLHVFFELGDHLGSTSVVLDKATGELVERSTYQAYGGTESDYRPERWKSFREDYRFTGKEEDVEVGLIYFGKRFLNPLLNRWVSADPLVVHEPAETLKDFAELGSGIQNAYLYSHGMVLRAIDPLGLRITLDASVMKSKKGRAQALGALQKLTADKLELRGDEVVIKKVATEKEAAGHEKGLFDEIRAASQRFLAASGTLLAA